MRAGLIGDNVHLHAAPHNLRQHVAAVAHQANRKRAPFASRLLAKPQSLVKVVLQSQSQ